MRVEVVAGRAASREAKATAEGEGWGFKMSVLRASGAAGMEYLRVLSEQAHVDVGVREHVKRLEWKTRYDESIKPFDENLQNS